MASTWMTVLQVVIGLLIVWGVYRLAVWMRGGNELVAKVPELNSSDTVMIAKGWASTKMAADHSWSTINPMAKNYLDLQRSLNRKGGAQFTYSFWMQLGDVSDGNVAWQDILLRGDAREYLWNTVILSGGSAGPDMPSSGVFVKCPRIRFGPSFDSFAVELNTTHSPDHRILITPYPAESGPGHRGQVDSTLRKNLLKLTQGRWVLHTFTFEDHVAISDFEDGIVVRYFLNDTMYHTARVASTLRQNNGDLFLLPSNTSGTSGGAHSLKSSKIGDVTYRNWAMSANDVAAVFSKGPPKNPCKSLMGMTDGNWDPLYLSEYNRLDVYNS